MFANLASVLVLYLSSRKMTQPIFSNKVPTLMTFLHRFKAVNADAMNRFQSCG